MSGAVRLRFQSRLHANRSITKIFETSLSPHRKLINTPPSPFLLVGRRSGLGYYLSNTRSMATTAQSKQAATASLNSGTPTGRVDKIHGLDCYIADPPQQPPAGVVVIVPDTYGWAMSNNRVLADEYARRGNFQVFLPDFMNGVVVPEDVQDSFKVVRKTSIWRDPIRKLSYLFYVLRYMLPFVWHCRPIVTTPRVTSFLRGIRSHEARDLPIGAAGFAWGGIFVIRACWDEENNRTSDGRRVLDTGFVAHPSNSKYPDHIDRIRLPIGWAAAETCRHMSPAQAELTKRILDAKMREGEAEGVEHELVVYKGVHYGFAQPSDRKKPAEAAAGEKAETQAVEWFKRQFAKWRA